LGKSAVRLGVAALAVAVVAGCYDSSEPLVKTAGNAPLAPVESPRIEFRSSTGSYLAGRLARNDHDTASAARFFSSALVGDPENPQLLRETYMAMHAEGRMAEATRLAERLIEVRPNAPIAALTIAIDDMVREDYANARRQLEALPRQGYNSLLAPLLTAWAAAGEGRLDIAEESLGGLTQSETFTVFREFHGALIRDLFGEIEGAEAAYRIALEGQPGGSIRVVVAFGSFYERQNARAQALDVYEGYRRENPDTVWLEAAMARLETGAPADRMVRDAREGASEVLFGVASALYQEDALEAAMLYLRLALHLRPDHDAGYQLLGEILEALDRPDEAIAAYETIDRLSPLKWTGRMRVASVLDSIGRIDEAAAWLREMAAERRDRADALIALGDMLRGRERWAEAVEAYDQALVRIERFEQRHWRALYARGIALERSKQWARAEQDFLDALDLVPDQPFVLNYLGYSWVDQGVNLDRAYALIERAVDLRPNDGYIIDSLGWALYRLGRYDDAVLHLERAVELRPEDPTINEHLGDAYWQVGRQTEARFQWLRALSLTPEEPGVVANIQEKLEAGITSGDIVN
jgi:Flp pilus assembly protein TadD